MNMEKRERRRNQQHALAKQKTVKGTHKFLAIIPMSEAQMEAKLYSLSSEKAIEEPAIPDGLSTAKARYSGCENLQPSDKSSTKNSNRKRIILTEKDHPI
ncbi:hypothetical protein PR048_018635 [Dryococelus australis]|uniref:Uncharacterized protein n=1 Tax=Dryococelus australis TaxID=614101 RepID=A0ABQ9HCU3_9NEOP|nr:hypothetical protein PR048_018635 [Dryococelus australis]